MVYSTYSLNEQSKWTLEWLLMPDGLICVFLKLLISWDFDKQWCLKFTQMGKKKRRNAPSEQKRYFLLMREVREWPGATGAFCECWTCSVCVRLFCSCYSLYFIDVQAEPWIFTMLHNSNSVYSPAFVKKPPVWSCSNFLKTNHVNFFFQHTRSVLDLKLQCYN